MGHVVGVVGASGRIAASRHLAGALVPLRAEGRIDDVVLVGRDAARLEQVGAATGCPRTTTDLADVLADPAIDVILDATPPVSRGVVSGACLRAGKHVIMEKPAGTSAEAAHRLLVTARRAGVTAAMVRDKLHTPGYRALARELGDGAVGRPCCVTGDFGYWVDDGAEPGRPPQRPSWNYARSRGGSLGHDLFSHWSYLLELVGAPVTVGAQASTQVHSRMDEDGQPYAADVPDLLSVAGLLDCGAQYDLRSGWVQRPSTPFTTAVHGTRASVVATPHGARRFTRSGPADDAGAEVRQDGPGGDEFRALWQEFLDVVDRRPGDVAALVAGVRAARFCDAAEESARSGRRIRLGLDGLDEGGS